MNLTRIATGIRERFETQRLPQSEPCFLVYYDGGPSSLAALREACAIAGHENRIVAVFLDEVPQTETMDDGKPVHDMLAQAVLAAAIVNASFCGVDIETLCIPCRVKGPALVTLAAECNSAMLFVGVEDHEPGKNLNPFADYVLSLAPCQVVLVGASAVRSAWIEGMMVE
jgi:nucleotide-binding universal stress UspA family protein